MNEKLERSDFCPHCGSSNFIIQKGKDKVHPYRVVCESCGCGTAWHGDWQEAFKAWTRRTPAQPDPRAEALVEALEKAGQLIDCIEQRSADNCWWVRADDPETAVCDVHHAICNALASFKAGVNQDG
jgi:hypothetical protein